MARRLTSVATPLAHLVGPGKLAVVNRQLVFEAYGTTESPLRLDPEALREVYCYGAVGVTDAALTLLFAHDVSVSFLTPSGARCKGRLVRGDSPRTGLRRLQHAAFAERGRSREWAELAVVGKIESQMAAARHYQRQGVREATEVMARLAALRASCAGAAVESLRGYEGSASAAWFELLGVLVREPFAFRTRVRRPPTDPVNALLSLGYTWVLQRVSARCEAAGLESNLGALHEWRAGRPSLACDVMEPLRVPAVDRWVVSMCNQGGVAVADFVEEKGGIRLREGLFGPILGQWQEHWARGALEAELDGWMARLVAWLRQGEPAEASEADGDL